jgi:hypothetical protein
MHFTLILAPAFLQTAAALMMDGLQTEQRVLVQCFSWSGYHVALQMNCHAEGGRVWNVKFLEIL